MRSALDAEGVSAVLSLVEAAALPSLEVLQRLGTTSDGLNDDEVASRRVLVGPNVIALRRVNVWEVLGRQLRSALLLLLVVTATLSFFVGDRTDAVIIGVILVVSIGLVAQREHRAELASQALHTQIRHEAVVRRYGRSHTVDVTDLVPGDLVHLSIGQVVPADVCSRP